MNNKALRTFAKWGIIIALFVYAVELMESHFGIFLVLALGTFAGLAIKKKFFRK